MSEDKELEELRKQKLLELQMRMEEEKQQKEMEVKRESIKKSILSQILEQKAKERLARVKLAYPQIAENVENELIYLAQTGKIQRRITDDELKSILKSVMPKKKDIKIIRR